MKTAVITGGSSGIGKSTAEHFAEKGYRVFELSRHGSDNGSITHIDADVTVEGSLAAAMAQIAEIAGGIDVVVCNAGMGISGAVELTEESDYKRIFDVNFFGCVRTAKAAIPYLRQTKGHLVLVSSVASVVSIPFQSFYSCTKAAINQLTLALASELKPFGIRVAAVMPGDVSTGFTDAREKNERGEELYGDAIKHAVGTMERDERGGMQPSRIARSIYRAASAKHPKPLRTVGIKYQLVCLLASWLPKRLSNGIVRLMYIN